MTRIQIEVAFAVPERQWVKTLSLEEGATAWEAARQSGLLSEFEQRGVEPRLGVFSKPVADTYLLKEGDRLEGYAPIEISPEEARALVAQAKGKSAFI